MNELQIFNNEEFGNIRTVTIDNEPWFVGKDVASSLGYSDTNKAVAMHVEKEDKNSTTNRRRVLGSAEQLLLMNPAYMPLSSVAS